MLAGTGQKLFPFKSVGNVKSSGYFGLNPFILENPDIPDPYKHDAGSRDGAMSSLLGIAARKSILEACVVRIEELTDIKPHPTRGMI